MSNQALLYNFLEKALKNIEKSVSYLLKRISEQSVYYNMSLDLE